jgi:DNA-binding transcriptional LysR family regulator
MKLNLRQIEVFRAIMVTGSVTGAANLLSVSQPAISRLLSYTEQRLGMVLFERVKNRLHPTPEARRLLAEVNSVYQAVQRVNELAEDLIEHRHGHLRIACSPSLGQGLLPRAVAQFLGAYPDARVSILTLIPSVLTHALLNQQADLGVVLLADAHPNLQSKLLYPNRLLVAMPQGHRLQDLEEVDLTELAGEHFVGYGSDMPIGNLLKQLFLDANLVVRPKVDAQQVHVACALVQEGVGLALIDELTAAGPVWTKVVKRPLRQMVDIPVHIQRHAMEPLSRLGHAFVETLEGMKADWSRDVGHSA